MAKFVIAGRADCPRFARAEMLADQLAASLPHFRVHKVSQTLKNLYKFSKKYLSAFRLFILVLIGVAG